PFNIMVLASQTSANNARDNKRLVFGGHYEGQEMHEVGKWIRFASPFRHLVGSLHALGISLGGHTALYTALYNDYNPINDDIKVYNSVIAHCPAINIKPTFKDLFEGGGLTAKFTKDSIWNSLVEAYDEIPDLHDLVDPKSKPSGQRLMEVFGLAAARFQSRIPEGTALFPFRDKPVTVPDDVWSLNNFVNQSEGITTPTLVWNAMDDSVLEFDLNGRPLSEKHPDARKGRLMVLNTPQGNHCSQSVIYGWEATASVLRAFIQDHSHDFYIKRRRLEFPVVFHRPLLPSGQLHMLQEWKAEKGLDHFEVKYTLFNNNWNCKKAGESKPSCYDTQVMKLGFNELPLTLQVPRTKVEAEILTRWANSRFEIHGASGRLIESDEHPEKIVYISDQMEAPTSTGDN
ncbi:MAG: hypothetical protein KDD43_05835, partial [Bdellovibrionales bacterium]|nr:hypothetical protein [Bdellovibrionales bacterium]